jgi:two-component system sensor histidine kinase DesK
MTERRQPLETHPRGFVNAFREDTHGWRRWLFPSVFLIYLLQTARGVVVHTDGVISLIGLAVLVAFCLCYLRGMVAGWSGRYRLFWRYYAAMLILCAIETPFAHEDAFVMLVYVGVLTVASLYGRSIPILAGYALIALAVPPLIKPWHASPQVGNAVSIVIVSLAMFGFFGIIRSNRALAEARSEVARLAAEAERTRIARDLHDLLGHSLTTITVKAGLAARVIERDPQRAATEIAQVEDLARQALTDVRAAVSGYRDVTLGNELAAAREVLRAAGISADLPGAIDSVGASESELFAWAVREAVTNVVRHSRASKCEVRLSEHAIEIVDNGVGSVAAAGNGLTGLRERVDDAGGRLTVEPNSALGGFRLRVEARV